MQHFLFFHYIYLSHKGQAVVHENLLTPDTGRQRHPSFETWLSGSSHSSEEFDTDVEEEDLSESKSVGC